MKKSILLVFLMFLYSGTTLTLHAQIFSQNFSSSSVLNDYISNTPTSGQFSAIVNSSGVVSSITNGQLRMVKTAQVASYFFRNYNASVTPAPTLLQMKFDFTVSNQAATNSVIPLYFGSSFSANGTGLTEFFSRVGLGISTTPGNFYLKIMDNGSTQSQDYTGKQTLTIITNNSGVSKSYLAPNSSIEVIGNDQWEVWVGNSKVFNDILARNPNINLGSFKLQYNASFTNATLDFDNFELKEISSTLPSPNLPNTPIADTSLSRPHIWSSYKERQSVINNINQFEWAKSIYYQLKSRVDETKEIHKLNPQTFLSSIPPLPGLISDRATHTEKLAMASEASILYYLTYDSAYAQLASDILSHYTDKLALVDTVNIRLGYFFDDWWLESRAAYPKIGITYDFVYHYINNPSTLVYDLATNSNKPFNNAAAQIAVRKLASNVFRSITASRSNHSVLAGNGALVNLLMIDNATTRDVYFNRFYSDPLNQPFDAYLWTLGRFTNQDIWPETISYSRDVHEIVLQSLNIIDRIRPQLNVINNNSRILDGSYKYANFFFPHGLSIRYGDSHRNINRLKVYQRLLAIATRKNLTNHIIKTREHLKFEYDRIGSYQPSITTETLEWYNPLDILWGINIPSITASTPIPIEPTVRIEHAGTIVQRNYNTNNIVNNGFMYTSGGASYVHAHATGIDMELYGNGVIHGVDNGTTDYESYQHDFYEVRHAAHNCVIVNSSAKIGTTTRWDHIMNKITLTASEPKPDMQPIAPFYNFSTQTLNDTLNNALQQRTISIIRTSDSTGYYIDFFRSKSNSINNYHDYLYHNIGDTMELKFNNNTLVPTSPSGKYTADIAGSVSGWKFFENVKSSGGLTSSIKTQISLNAINKYMFVFTPAGVNREYATATAPVTDGAEFGYGTKPTRVFTIRQYGEAWNRPFINAFEPTTQLNTTIQSIEQITNGSKAVGAKVISLVNGETITDYIISHEDDTSTYNNSSLNFTFKGRFGILRLSEKSGVTKSTLYIGSGTNMIFNTRVLTANSDGSGYLGEQVLPVKLISFSAKAVNKGVELNWKTALEYNSKKFKLYHSSDGINFKSLVEINSLNTPSNYKYLHESPNNNTNYYKLIQTDFDNKQNNLGVRVVNYNVNLGKSVSIFPNPTNKLVNIQFNTNTNEKVRVQIISSFGKTLQEEYILVTSDKQKYILELNKNINAGMYIIQMSTPQKTIYTDKLIVR